MQYHAEAARLLSLTSDQCKRSLSPSIDPTTNILYSWYTDLADRFRSLTTAHAQVTGLSTFLQLAYAQYKSAVLGFAKDLQMAEFRANRHDKFWVASGLCANAEDAVQLFEVADATIRSADQPNDIEATVYHAHGRFLNVLANLHGEAPHRWPALPSAPTFSSKHAPHVADPLDVGSLTPPAQPPAALPLVSPAPSSRKDKGKGRAIEPVPLFLETSPSVEPEAALATEPPSGTIPGLPELGELSSPEPDLQSSLEPFADMALDLAFPGEEPDASSTDEEDGAYQEEGEGSGGEEGEEY